jgi:hypothetical protein
MTQLNNQVKDMDMVHRQNYIDLPPKDVPHLKLEFCHFLILNANTPLALEDGNAMNYAV